MEYHFDLATAWDNDWVINGKRAKSRVREYLNDSVPEQLDYGPSGFCPYCSKTLTHKFYKQFSNKDRGPGDEFLTRHYFLERCLNCSYWGIKGYEGSMACMDPVFLMSAASVTAKFSTASPHGCSEELAQHLRRKPELWHCLAPTRLETLVADIFKANHKHAEVKHVGGPGDLGVDVLFIDDNSTKWLIQVKRREKPNKAEGFETLQNILGTLALQGERHGIIVSTADHFSFQAKREVKNAAKQGFQIELIDKGILNRMVGPLLPRHPWKEVFMHPELTKMMGDIQNSFLRLYENTVVMDEPEKPYVDPRQLKLF